MSRPVDQEAVREAWRLHRKGKTHEEIGDRIGRGPRQVGSYLNLKWLEDRNLLHLQFGPIEGRRPNSPLQQEVIHLCEAGDHAWMNKDRFAGSAFHTQTGQGPESTIVWEERICWFCEYPQRVKPKIPAGAGIEGLFPR